MKYIITTRMGCVLVDEDEMYVIVAILEDIEMPFEFTAYDE